MIIQFGMQMVPLFNSVMGKMVLMYIRRASSTTLRHWQRWAIHYFCSIWSVSEAFWRIVDRNKINVEKLLLLRYLIRETYFFFKSCHFLRIKRLLVRNFIISLNTMHILRNCLTSWKREWTSSRLYRWRGNFFRKSWSSGTCWC